MASIAYSFSQRGMNSFQRGEVDEAMVLRHIKDQIERQQERDPERIAEIVYDQLPRDKLVSWSRSSIELKAASAVAAETVRAIIGMPSSSPYAHVAQTLADVLPRNPRRRKRIANQILLNSLIADRRQILGSNSSLTIEHVAKWTVLGTLWPSVRDSVILQPKRFVEEERAIRERPPKGSEDRLVAFLRTDPPFGDCTETMIHMTGPA
jgi:hypothetical protein